jgi:hypothetical protein
MSQPLLNIRLPTYLSSNKLPDKNLIGLGSSGVARHYCRNRCLLSFPQGTKMFQFPWLPLPSLYIQLRVTRHDSSRVSPFGNLRFKACLSAPRSLSQITTSFIGILRQGIPCVRLCNFLRNKRQINLSLTLKVQLTSYWRYQ